jgi:hypothetical protein
MRFVAALAFLLGALPPSLVLGARPAHAQIVLGAILSLTGPGAGLGIPERNTIPLLPKEVMVVISRGAYRMLK